ncbi:MAG: NAD(P)-binding protein, partial [Rikenella sp.]|nr:NAD(P)-binding protein [Rikenella sp.]
MEQERILVIGGGIAGMQAAAALREEGFAPLILERSLEVGGHVAGWDRLFPTQHPAQAVIEELAAATRGIETVVGCEISALNPTESGVAALTAD